MSQKLNRATLSHALDAPLDIPAPKGKEYMPFQKAGIFYALFNPFIHTLIGDQPGLGKTVQAIGVMNYRPGVPILIVCPASLMTNWKRHVEDWSVKKLTVQMIKTSRDELRDCDCFIISFNLASTKIMFDKLIKKQFYYLVFDEVHYLKTPNSRRTRACLGSKGRGGLKAIAKYVIALSGTPLPNRPIELYPLITSLCPEALTKNGVVMGYETYGFKYCGGHYDSEGRVDFNGYSNLKELGKRLRSTFMVRRKKSEVLKDLPDKINQIVYLNSDPEVEKIVDRMGEFKISELKGEVAVSYEGLSEMRRELGELKAPIAAEYIKNQLESGHEKVVVFAHHKDCIRILNEQLSSYGVCKLVGSTPKDERQGIVDRFQNDSSYRVFIGSITAAGVGLTLTAASYVVFVEASWVPGENEQSSDRCHRIGQKDTVLSEFLVFENSLDERILKSHMTKDKNIKQIMGD